MLSDFVTLPLAITLPVAYIIDPSHFLIGKALLLVTRRLETCSSPTPRTLDSC
jgi:hypothetical protein